MSALVGRRYAVALYEIAKEQNKVAEFAKDCQFVAETLQNSRQLLNAVKSPIINQEKKIALLKAVFSGKVSKLVEDALALLARKGRSPLILDVMREFQALLDEQSGVVTAQVESAVPLGEAETQAIAEKLEAYSGKKVRVEVKVNPALIGGFAARIGDTVIDGSVRRQLERLKERFKQVSLN
ncbi:MAG: ATP synthase F1 subunit delta [Chloroherpetonaceae bacterium]|nr:ATP synthase F1 subunit delta [Chloroherpetonaceae bacterium]MDW8437681.1 ATP synthase F1 subunit delta [Chloroherpetonaceae bacterium]